MIGGQQFGLHHGRAREPVALKQRDADALEQVKLLLGFHLGGNQVRLAVACCVADQYGQLLGAQHVQIQFDVVGQRQPGRVGRFQHGMVERQFEAAFAQRAQNGQPCYGFACGHMPQWLHFQYHFFGVQQFQMPARQTFMGAVDKQQLGAHQIFAASVRQGSEQQNHIGGCGVLCRGA